jgi:hypothetical protein
MRFMRTTLDLDDAVLAAAKELAAARNSSTGAVISDLARKGLSLSEATATRARGGFPTFCVPVGAAPMTSATVKSVLSDEGLPA